MIEPMKKRGKTEMKKVVLLILMGALLVGCGTNGASTGNNNVNTENGNVVRENTENTTEDEQTPPGYEVFSQLPDSFYFSSGAGAWGTDLYLEDDGTFHGTYHDSDAGSTGEGYPNGTVYISVYSGKFAPPTAVNEFSYSTTIEYLNIEREDEEYIEDGVRYIVTEPYGIAGANEIIFYMFGTPNSMMAQGFLDWVQPGDLHPEGELLCYGLYNVSEEDGFTGSIIMDEEDVKKLGGTYTGENGDTLTIQLELDEYSYDIGEVYWSPIDGESERGNIKINRKGGFTIYLDYSVSYDFVMVNNTEGKIELKCTNRGQDDVIFKIQ